MTVAYNPSGQIPYLGKLLTTVTNYHLQNRIGACAGASAFTCSTAIVTGSNNQWLTALNKAFADYYLEASRYGYGSPVTMSVAQLSDAIANVIESRTYGGVSLARANQIVAAAAARGKAFASSAKFWGISEPVKHVAASRSAYAVAPTTKLERMRAALSLLQQPSIPGAAPGITLIPSPQDGTITASPQYEENLTTSEPKGDVATEEEKKKKYLLYAGVGAVALLGVAFFYRRGSSR